MKARTPSQAGNLLSALRGMIRWMIDEGHLDEDDDPTIGVRSGKAKASRESGGFLPWTEDDMARYRTKWPLGTEARLMFDILHYTFLRLGDCAPFRAAASAPDRAQLVGIAYLRPGIVIASMVGRSFRDFLLSLGVSRRRE